MQINIDKNKIVYYELVFALAMCIVWLLSSLVGRSGFASVLFCNQYDSFMDFFHCIGGYSSNPYIGESGTNYPPMAVLFFQMCRRILPPEVLEVSDFEMRMYQTPIMLYSFFIMISVAIVIYTFNKKVIIDAQLRGLFLLVMFLSFPMLFAYERGNIIILSFALSVYFVGFYADESRIKRHVAYVALAIASAIKIYPAVFAILLVKERKIKESCVLLGYGIVAFFAPFWAFGGTKAIKSFMNGLLGFVDSRSADYSGFNYMVYYGKKIAGIFETEDQFSLVMPESYAYNFSIKNIFTVCQNIRGGHIFYKGSTVLWIGVMILLLGFTILAKTKWKTLLGCSLLILLVPGVSIAYSLIFLAIPMGAFLVEYQYEESKGIQSIIDIGLNMLVLFLFIPWNLPVISGFGQQAYMTYSHLLYFCDIFFILFMCFVEIMTLNARNQFLKTITCVGVLLGINIYVASVLVSCIAY